MARLETQRDQLSTEVEDLRAQRYEAMARIEEARHAQTQIAVLEAGHQRLLAQITQTEDRLADRDAIAADLVAQRREADELEEKSRRLRASQAQFEVQIEQLAAESAQRAREVDELRAQRQEAMARIEEARRAEARVMALDGEHQRLLTEIAEARNDRCELDAIDAHLAARRREAGHLDEDLQRLQACRAQLESQIKALQDTGPGHADAAQLLADLTRFPAFLNTPAVITGARQTESEALREVDAHLARLGLQYSRRTVRAFHTALKINDHAQITVLSGVSGTGKSLLPRRYAEAMGLHFLQIAAEPRWDSPQDLLGFYNYIEKSYRATDLARLLVHMDPYTSVRQPDGAPVRSDHMALVLLDEMNLARIEYYFSEFLSRLEVRPHQSEAHDPDRRRGAQLPVDIRGLSQPVFLFPSHNVLFVGTMNDDESTQSLSDKVLDRGNVMQFPAPDFSPQPSAGAALADPTLPLTSRQAQSFRAWRSWTKPIAALDAAHRAVVEDGIAELARIMERCGRPFGHRLRNAILAYVANYPRSGHGSGEVLDALADQVEFRILPKLRGIVLDAHEGEFEALEALIGGTLEDGPFARELKDTRERQSRGTGLFAWRGLKRQAGLA